MIVESTGGGDTSTSCTYDAGDTWDTSLMRDSTHVQLIVQNTYLQLIVLVNL